MIETRGAGLTAVVAPGRGAKIVSLVDDTGREWLAQGDAAAAFGPDVAFVDAEMAGWDECAPSIVSCIVDGKTVPDHGDLWNVSFSREGGSTLVATGHSLGYRFTRSIHHTSTGLQLSYTARALQDPIPFLWAAHPQFSAPRGTWVELAHAVRGVDVLDPTLPTIVLNRSTCSIDSVPKGGTRKWYVEPTRRVFAARLRRSDGSGLELTWSQQCPYLGVWFDNQAHSREPVIAIEPSTGYFDSLVSAVNNKRVSILTPGQDFCWRLRLRVFREDCLAGHSGRRQPDAGVYPAETARM